MLRSHIVPELGETRVHELTTRQVNALLADLGQQSVNRQRKAKVILGAMLDTAVTYGALATNPARGSLSISRPAASHPALSPGDVANVQAAVRAWLSKQRPGPRSSGDMADIIELMLATGARIGEVLALRWRDINLDARSIEINATIKTESGQGNLPKGDLSYPHGRVDGVRGAPSQPAAPHDGRQPARFGLPDPQRDVAADQQRGAPLASDSPSGGPGLDHA